MTPFRRRTCFVPAAYAGVSKPLKLHDQKGNVSFRRIPGTLLRALTPAFVLPPLVQERDAL
eukprot:5677809-Prymnesium_polylepis.2